VYRDISSSQNHTNRVRATTKTSAGFNLSMSGRIPDCYVVWRALDRLLFGSLPSEGQGVGASCPLRSVVNALAKAGVDLGGNGSVIPKPKGKRENSLHVTLPKRKACLRIASVMF
jgi:hypothetical protein